jgi:hypothetical protein
MCYGEGDGENSKEKQKSWSPLLSNIPPLSLPEKKSGSSEN